MTHRTSHIRALDHQPESSGLAANQVYLGDQPQEPMPDEHVSNPGASAPQPVQQPPLTGASVPSTVMHRPTMGSEHAGFDVPGIAGTEGITTTAEASQPTDTKSTLGSVLSPTFMALGVVALLWASLRMMRKRAAKARSTPRLTPKEKIEEITSRASSEYGSRQHADTILAQMLEQTRQLTATMDNKALVLERLIADTDERIAALVSLQNRSNQNATATSQYASPPTPRRDSAFEPPRPPTRREVPSDHKEIYELADRGLRSIDIARRMDREIGQIELILSLRSRSA